MEYHVSKKIDVASRIFDKGFEMFPDEVQLVMRHLSFLISVNDDQSKLTHVNAQLCIDS